jgi:NAD(P)-dependent dehydrogenase (short-subunit alcohol dehydrogenase family)
MANDARAWLITGSSTGFGRSLAEAVLEKGDRVRLMLGVDAFGLWDKKRAALDEELAQWREIGENTAFPGVEVGAIGG